ncbi:MAG: aldehyde dehydrogenase family protein [Acidimicrobiales bacterium]
MSPTDPTEAVQRLRATFDAGTTRPVAWRREQLVGLRQLLADEEQAVTDALREDLGRSPTLAQLTELGVANGGIDHTLKHLDEWMKPQRVKVPVAQKPGRAEITPEPLGVVCVISPWNYPLLLLLGPMTAALAAGNSVLAKPSELAPATSAVLADLIPRHLDTDAVAIVEGGPDVAEAVLAQRFDHIFFTGSAHIGRAVMTAAAAHLTPVTLELGGKSPAIVDRSAKLDVTARRIVLGKFINAGQTCIAPDHVLVDESIEDELIDQIAKVVTEFYGDDPQTSGDYGRIINDRHLRRLQGLLDGGGFDEIVVGGDVDAADRYVAPTVLRGVAPDAPVMGEEIFGPILPVLPVDSIDDAVRFVNEGPKPLALYMFGEDDELVDQVVHETSSGGVCTNHTLMQFGVHDLPFGGVGESGFGAYHGKAGFDTFSHHKSVLRKSVRPDPSVLYPPYGRWKSRMLRSAL